MRIISSGSYPTYPLPVELTLVCDYKTWLQMFFSILSILFIHVNLQRGCSFFSTLHPSPIQDSTYPLLCSHDKT